MLYHPRFALSPLSIAVFTLLFVGSASLRLAQAQTATAPDAAASAPAPGPAVDSSGGGVTLAPVTAKAAAPVDASTEGSGSYAAPATTIGKGTLKQREIPHSMTVITREQLNDQNITTIEGALKNVTGVTVQRFDATGSYTQFIARGYAADSYQLDGLNLQTDTNGVYFDLAAYDRIEVQRGAASLFSGAGEPGVTVNMARKRAHDTPQTNFGVQYGSWDDRRIDLDTTGALNEAGTLRGRVVGVYQDFDTFMDGVDNNRKRMLYGTLELDLSSRTTLSVGATYQHIDTVLSRGLPTYTNLQLLAVPRETMPIQSWNFQALQSETVFAELEHRGLDDSLLKFALRHLRRTNDANYLDPAVANVNGTMGGGGANNSTQRLSAAAFEREDVDNTVDLYYSKPFQAWGLKHNLLVGADYRDTRADLRYSGIVWLPDTLDLNHFTPDSIAMPAFDLDTQSSTAETHAYGVYSQLRIKPAEDWTLVGGGRWGSWSSSGMSYSTPQDYDAKKFIPYAAVINDLTKSLSAYASYNQIFKPQNNTGTAPGNGPLPPRTGRQYELGLKGEEHGGRLMWSVAVYDLRDENRAVTDGNITFAAGKARSRGAEFEARGDITPTWSLSGGYAYGKNEYVENPGNNSGLVGTALLPFAPRHSYNLWTRHKFDLGPVTGMTGGFGLRGNSEFSNGTGASEIRAGGYTIYGLNLSAPINKELRVALNVDNLFDKNYWEKVSGATRQNFFGEPRRITVALQGSY